MDASKDPMRDIDSDEQWLKGMADDLAPANLDRVKLAVQIAVHERWLAAHLRDEIPNGLADRAKRAVRGALAEGIDTRRIHGGRARSRRMIWPWASGLAAAAVIGLLLIFNPLGRGGDDESLSAIRAFEAFNEDALGDAVDALGYDLWDLELSVGELASYAPNDEAFDDLLDRIDILRADDEVDDWS